MTVDEAMRQVAAVLDEAWERSGDNADLIMVEHGATDDEVAALRLHREALWRDDREQQLQQTRAVLESWLARDGGSLH